MRIAIPVASAALVTAFTGDARQHPGRDPQGVNGAAAAPVSTGWRLASRRRTAIS